MACSTGDARRREAEGVNHVYLRNLNSGFIGRISHAPAGDDADGPSFHPAVSGDGRLVAFASQATNLVPRDRNRVADVYLHDVHTGQTTLVSRSARGGSATGASRQPALSADGRFVAFVSDAADLACASRCPNRLLDLNLVADVYVFDTLTHDLARVSGARAKIAVVGGQHRPVARRGGSRDRILVAASDRPERCQTRLRSVRRGDASC